MRYPVALALVVALCASDVVLPALAEDAGRAFVMQAQATPGHASGPGHAHPGAASAPPIVGKGAVAPDIPGAIPGIEKFDRDSTPLTMICGAETYRVRYSSTAQTEIAAALAKRRAPAESASIEKVDIRLRCHSEGIAGLSSRCYATAALAVRVGDRGDATSRLFESAGRNSESVAFHCGTGRQALEYALEQAVGRLTYSIGSDE